jgi:RNA exonuclease 1
VALDAEMFYTVGGYEVSRLTLVDFETEATLLDVLIEPRCAPVLDYNTKWSGVSAESYRSGELQVLKFAEAQKRLAEFIGSETILIGHSLDNDLRVLEVNSYCNLKI